MFILNNVREILQLHEYRVASAMNGREALAYMQTLQPGVILADILMPYLDGRAPCARVNATPLLAHIPFLIITASAELQTVEAALAAGAADYLVKPFTPKQLISIVEKTLRA